MLLEGLLTSARGAYPAHDGFEHVSSRSAPSPFTCKLGSGKLPSETCSTYRSRSPVPPTYLRWSIVSSKLRETDEGTCIRYLPAGLQGCRSCSDGTENLKIWDHYDINKNNTSNNTQRCASFRTTDRLLIPGRLISANTAIWAHTIKAISYDWRQNERRRN